MQSENTQKSNKFSNFFKDITRRTRSLFFNEPLGPRGSHETFAEYIQQRTPKDLTAQEVQGMWQAYGQMRAAKIAGRFTILATGFVGVSLWIYQQTLSRQRSEIEAEQKVLVKQKELLARQREAFRSAVKSATVFGKRYEVADRRAREAYGNNQARLKEYQNELLEAEKEALGEINEKIDIKSAQRP